MTKNMPKYKEIEQDLLSRIWSGELKPGDQVMTEHELCDEYAVSRMTARKALEALAAQGIVRRTAGKGTFVNSIHIKKESHRLTSFTYDIRSVGMTPGSILAEYKVRRAAEIPDIAGELKVTGDSLIHCICRVRTADDVKVALNYTYIPCEILPALDPRMLEGSIYEHIQQQHGISPYFGSRTISAVIASPKQRRLLGIGNEALLRINHPGYLIDGRPFEYTITYYVGSRIVYTNNNGQFGCSYQLHPGDGSNQPQEDS